MPHATPAPGRSTPGRVHAIAQRAAVIAGTVAALIGTAIFARGMASGLRAAVDEPVSSSLVGLGLGLVLVSGGIVMATTTRYGRSSMLAGLGAPLVMLGAGLGVFGVFDAGSASEVIQTASTGATQTASAAGGAQALLVASGILVSMVGAALLFVFGRRVRGKRMA